MDPTEPAVWDAASTAAGPVGVLGVLALGAFQAWVRFGGKKPAPVAVAPVVEVVDAEARERLTALEHQTKTTADELARMRKTQQQDHDILGKLDERLDGIRDMLVFIRDRD